MSLTQPLTRPLTTALSRAISDPGVGGGVFDPATDSTYYVDSVNGSDANDGLTAATAKQTIGALPTVTAGQSIGLARGSYWREMLKPAAQCRVAAYGAAATPPTLDGADVIPGASFTASAHADAAGVVYEVSLSRDPNGVYVSGDTYMMWEGGAWLSRQTSVALVAANPGSFYLPQPNMLAAASTAYVHPFGSTNPISDGKTYEYSKRSSGIEMAQLDNCIVEGVHTKRGGGAYGSLTLGRYSTARKCLFSYGGKHNIVAASGVFEDCIAFDAEMRRSVLADGGMIPWTIYKPASAGLSFTLNRCMSIFPTGRNAVQGVYSHNSSGAIYDSATINGFISLRGGTVEPLAITLRYDDVCSVENTKGLQISPAAGTVCDISRALVKVPSIAGATGLLHPAAGGTAGNPVSVTDSLFVFEAGASTTGNPISFQISGLYDFNHNTVHSISGSAMASVTASAGSVISECLFVNGRTGSQVWNQGNAGTALNNNVYATHVANSNYWWQTPGSGTAFSITEWRSESGNDVNSLSLNPTQAGDLMLGDTAANALGDLRIDPAYAGTLVDGTPVYGNIGPQNHYNWNTRTVVAGAPSRFPTPPATEAECAAYIVDPEAWNFYP